MDINEIFVLKERIRVSVAHIDLAWGDSAALLAASTAALALLELDKRDREICAESRLAKLIDRKDSVNPPSERGNVSQIDYLQEPGQHKIFGLDAFVQATMKRSNPVGADGVPCEKST